MRAWVSLSWRGHPERRTGRGSDPSAPAGDQCPPSAGAGIQVQPLALPGVGRGLRSALPCAGLCTFQGQSVEQIRFAHDEIRSDLQPLALSGAMAAAPSLPRAPAQRGRRRGISSGCVSSQPVACAALLARNLKYPTPHRESGPGGLLPLSRGLGLPRKPGGSRSRPAAVLVPTVRAKRAAGTLPCCAVAACMPSGVCERAPQDKLYKGMEKWPQLTNGGGAGGGAQPSCQHEPWREKRPLAAPPAQDSAALLREGKSNRRL